MKLTYFMLVLWLIRIETTTVPRFLWPLFIRLLSSMHSALAFDLRYSSRYMNPPPVLTTHPDSFIWSYRCLVPIRYLPEASFTIGKKVASSISRAFLNSCTTSTYAGESSSIFSKEFAYFRQFCALKESITRFISLSTASPFREFPDDCVRPSLIATYSRESLTCPFDMLFLSSWLKSMLWKLSDEWETSKCVKVFLRLCFVEWKKLSPTILLCRSKITSSLVSSPASEMQYSVYVWNNSNCASFTNSCWGFCFARLESQQHEPINLFKNKI